MADATKGKPLPSRMVPASVMKMMAPRAATKAKGSGDSKSTLSEAICLGSTEDMSKKRKRGGEEDLPQPGTAAASIITAGFFDFDAATLEATPFRDFTITLDMLGKTTLGIDVDWADGRSLLVKSVQSGAISDWNFERGPEKALRPGDRIVAVNGQSGERIGAVALVQECKGKSRVQLQIRTQRPLIHRPVPAKPEVSETTEAEAQQSPPKRQAKKSLYSFLPAPDPENDRSAGSRAKGIDPFSEPAAAETPRLAIFLDIDGVLRRCEGRNVISVEGEVLPLHLLSRKFEAEAVRALRYLIHRTGAGIVLSSEWRRDKALREEVGATLRTAGLSPMRGVTPVFEPREEVAVGPPNSVERESGPATMRLRWAERRAREISAFLRERSEIQRWVALDDLDLSMADDKSLRLADTLWMGPGLVLCEADKAFTMSDARKAVELLLKS